jgi:hypothetical protein
MSSNSLDTTAYYSAYKTAVYNNLLVGIVYGTQLPACSHCRIINSLFCTTGIYVILYVVSVRILL